MHSLDSMENASTAQTHQFTMDALHMTVAIQCSFHSKYHKQLERMMQGIQIKKNFEIWFKIEED